MVTVNTTINKLKKAFPKISGIHDASEWSANYDKNSVIHLGDCAEGGEIDGLLACNYYTEDYEETVYIMGVHKKLVKLLNDNGFYAECYDPGTYLAFRL